MEKLDKTDIKILDLLQKNSQFTIKEIAQAINLSITPIHERIKRLENDGIISKYMAILNRAKMGKWLVVHCQVTLDKQTQNNFTDFEEAVKNFNEVTECSVVSGGFDYLLKVMVQDMEDYNAFYQTKLAVIESVAHINSYFVMKEVKSSPGLPMDRWLGNV
jgi:Lrp/AsnC family transcriptional regulator, leucine-responsive regulatory protein